MSDGRALRVELTEGALADVDEIYAWIHARAPEAAARWFAGFEDHVASLALLPDRCPVAPESAAFHREVRHLLFGRYRILFTIAGGSVQVMHVRHGARLPGRRDEIGGD